MGHMIWLSEEAGPWQRHGGAQQQAAHGPHCRLRQLQFLAKGKEEITVARPTIDERRVSTGASKRRNWPSSLQDPPEAAPPQRRQSCQTRGKQTCRQAHQVQSQGGTKKEGGGGSGGGAATVISTPQGINVALTSIKSRTSAADMPRGQSGGTLPLERLNSLKHSIVECSKWPSLQPGQDNMHMVQDLTSTGQCRWQRDGTPCPWCDTSGLRHLVVVAHPTGAPNRALQHVARPAFRTGRTIPAWPQREGGGGQRP